MSCLFHFRALRETQSIEDEEEHDDEDDFPPRETPCPSVTSNLS
jgi:hypothetical protein